MSRASEWVKAIRECPAPFDVNGERFAYVHLDGNLHIKALYLRPEHIPDFIAWLHDTFVAETKP